jgi:hypothetical protein
MSDVPTSGATVEAPAVEVSVVLPCLDEAETLATCVH